MVPRIVLICVAAALAAQQPPGEATLPAAIAKMQAGDFAGAVGMLDAVTKKEPRNARAWRNLGLASQRLNRFDEAIAAYLTALEIEPESALTAYNLGCAYARKDDREKALAYLTRAKALKMDLTNAANDPDLARLKSEPRFGKLLPKPADFANPFVESVKVLREWDGEAAGDQFGWIARNLGDVDGDGIADIVTSAPTKDIGGAKAGRVYVYSTRSGKLLWQVDGHPGDQLGTGVEGAGDTNHDGVPDVVASAPGAGKGYIFSGKDGRLLQTFTAEDIKDNFGQHVSPAGDINHDGYADVAIGAPGHGTGRVYVYSGKDGSLLLTLSGEREGDGFGSAVAGYSDKNRGFLLAGAPRAGERKNGRTYVYDGSGKLQFTIEADDTGRALGAMFLSVPGDVDGDGVPDVYASDFSNAAKGPGTGRVYIHSGKDGHRIFTFTGETAGEGFGIGVAGAGDVDHDGHADLIIGSWQYGGAAVSGGRAYLYSGRDGRVLRTYTCKIPGDTFGFDAVGMGDTNGDGVTDLLITSAWSGIHGYHSGRMFVISSGVK